MATIEERAKQYTDNVYEVVMSGDFNGDCIAKNAYIAGATEQRKIDIDKAYEFMYNFKLPNGVAPLYDYVGNLRRAMEAE